MFRKILFTSIILLFATTTFAKEELTIYTYDSFMASWGPGPAIKKSFEEKCNCKLNFVGLDDGASILSRLRLEGTNTKANIVLGLDTNLMQIAQNTKLIAKHKVDTKNLTLPKKWENEYFIPFDYGYYAFIYNSEKIKTPPSSMKEFLNTKNTLIYQDPRTSTVGFGLLLWLEKLYGKDANKAWKKIANKTITVPKGWSEAYNMFLKGESDYVLSYTTSPAYHLIAEKKSKYKAVKFKEGHYLQTEVVAKTINNKNSKLADEFMNFVLSEGFQKHIPTGNWMYPVTNTKLPKEFSELIKVKTLELDNKKVSENRKNWIRAWQEVIAK